ncbi:transaldolase [Campylobacter sp.]|uniref:transaldolase n=1 Tax=Campylobacter sp. TaxID=205 RepID=UPI0026DD11AC|nr:transaldolase [Campylobacter sp.]MDO4674900.1 transaldolase [Campylobacter sp.]
MKTPSLWCDFIENDFLDREFPQLLVSKINGATSNPAIFKAALSSPSYTDKIAKLRGKGPKEIYEALAIQDIQKAADKLAFKFAQGDDGFISLEIDPRLHDNAALSIGEAKRLYSAIAKENLMMKIPATPASYEAMFELMKSGIHVNATLIFSPEQARLCFEALSEGLRAFRRSQFSAFKSGEIPKEPSAVISIFVSRLDTALNSQLKEKNQIGILNATQAYQHIMDGGEGRIRPLFASTGVKDATLPKDYYIKALLFEGAINTAPLDAIRAFRGGDFQIPSSTRPHHLLSQEKLNQAYKNLLSEGLNAFCVAFEDILKAF